MQGEALEGSCTRSPGASPVSKSIPRKNVPDELERQIDAETGRQSTREQQTTEVPPLSFPLSPPPTWKGQKEAGRGMVFGDEWRCRWRVGGLKNKQTPPLPWGRPTTGRGTDLN